MKKLLEIARQFEIPKVSAIKPFGMGLINDTYLVTTTGNKKFILQKLHRIFKPELLWDTAAITDYLASKKMLTLRLVKTGNQYGVIDQGDCWRMQTYVPGRTYQGGINGGQAYSGGALIGRFHNALSDFTYQFRHKMPEFHATEIKINRLKEKLKEYKNDPKYPKLEPLAREILSEYDQLPKTIPHLPRHIVHGDLKINNIRFSGDGSQAITLLDLDTIGTHSVAVDIGDAARTWCNHAEEGDIQNARFSIPTFKKMVGGYLSQAKFLNNNEVMALAEGPATIMLELSARFIIDAFMESYFKLTPKFKTLFDQNSTRAQAQMALYRDYKRQEKEIIKFIKSCRQ